MLKVSWKSFYSKFYDRDWNLKAEEVKHSYQALGKIYHLIGMMKNELSYAGSEFGEMFECLSKKWMHHIEIGRLE